MHQDHHGNWIRDYKDYSAGEQQNFLRNPEPAPVVVVPTTTTAALIEKTVIVPIVHGPNVHFRQK